jgi:hypothetical protein
MRIIKTIVLCLFTVQSLSQNIDTLLSKKNLPKELEVDIKKNGGTLGSFPTNYIAEVTFKSDSASVRYFVFNYQPTDSTNFKKAEDDYWIVSGCNIVLNKASNKNFGSFIYDRYFFLLQHCACRTGLHENCARLAYKVNQWRKVR